MLSPPRVRIGYSSYSQMSDYAGVAQSTFATLAFVTLAPSSSPRVRTAYSSYSVLLPNLAPPPLLRTSTATSRLAAGEHLACHISGGRYSMPTPARSTLPQPGPTPAAPKRKHPALSLDVSCALDLCQLCRRCSRFSSLSRTRLTCPQKLMLT